MSQSNESNPSSLRDIYLRALDKKSPEARDAYLEGACGDNLSLRNKVDALLRENAEDSFLEAPAIENNDTLLDAPTETPGTVIGRYKILQPIGEGGFGTVYMAEQKEPVKRRVALKIIKLGMDTKQVVARFEAERQALAMMDHPNIAKVLDAGATDAGRPYFVMELVRGISITKYCDENNLSALERLNLFMDVCSAIQHAHQKGIIHRDIKPSNIMITLHDGEPVPKVIDFGIAKATQQELTEKTLFTQYSQFIGTPAYISPEQAEMSGLDVDTRSDIYSLGVLLYELLTGRTPLDRESLMSGGYDEIRRRIREEEPSKPSTRVSTMIGEERTKVAKQRNVDAGKLSHLLRGDLDWVVMKALEKDRTRRYETANALRSDVQRFLNNEPVTAVKPSATYLLGKYMRRHKTVVGFAAAIAFLLVAATAVSGLFALKARKAENDREKERDVAIEAKNEATLAKQNLEKSYLDSIIQQAKSVQAAGERGYQTSVAELIREAIRLKPNEEDIFKLRSIGLATILDQESYPYQSLEHMIPNAESITRIKMFGETCAFGYRDGHVGIHDVLNGNLLFELKGSHRYPISSMVTLPKSNTWVSVDDSGHIVVWKKTNALDVWGKVADYDVPTNDLLPKLTVAGNGFILGFLYHDKLLYWSNPLINDHVVISLPEPLDYPPHADMASMTLPVSVDHTGEWLAIGLNHPSRVATYNLSSQTFGEEIRMDGMDVPVFPLPAFDDRHPLLTCYATRFLGVYETGTWHLLAKRSKDTSTINKLAAVSPSGDQILFRSEYGKTVYWNFKNDENEVYEEVPGRPFFTEKNGLLAIAAFARKDHPKSWKISLLQSNQAPKKIIKTGAWVAYGSSFNHAGNQIAVASGDSVRLYDSETLSEVSLNSNKQLEFPEDPSFAPEDQWLASVNGGQNQVLIWNTQSKNIIERIECPDMPRLAVFHVKKPLLAICGRGFIQLWNCQQNSNRNNDHSDIQLELTYSQTIDEEKIVNSIQFSDDGRYLAYTHSGRDIWGGHLYLLDLSSTNPTPIRISEYEIDSHSGFDFLPNSSSLVFLEWNESEWREVSLDVSRPSTPPRKSEWKHADVRPSFFASPQIELGMINFTGASKVEFLSIGDKPDYPMHPIMEYQFEENQCTHVTWSHDGNWASFSLNHGEVQIWNMIELRRQLAALGLDW